MMRPMKLGGEQILFGRGCLEHLAHIPCQRAAVVIGGASLRKNGILGRVEACLRDGGAEVFLVEMGSGEPDMSMVLKGAEIMRKRQPDLIVALGGGSVMDGAKAMWICYEHEELHTLADLMAPGHIGKLREKARMCCIPSTSGTASEVSRSIVITDERTGLKCGIGNMELVPDIAVCDPEVTVSVPPRLTAETGMDALTHAMEALTSTRANYISDVLAMQAVKDIFRWLPAACEDGRNLEAREAMQNASMAAGLAFTNVSLGIVHSMAHALGGYFKIPHGLANAVLLPYIIRYNRENSGAGLVYERVEKECGCENLEQCIWEMNRRMNIPGALNEMISEPDFMGRLDELAAAALADGCTKTNPVIPDDGTMKRLFCQAYDGSGVKEWS